MKPADPCARWMTLSDLVAVGDALGEDDASFLERHPKSCAACAAEAGVWGELESLLHAKPPGTVEHAEHPAAPPKRTRTRRLFAATGALVAAAAAVALWMRPHAAVPMASVPPPRPAGTLTLLEGETRVNAQPPAAGATFAAGATITTGDGRACARIDPTIRVCLGRQSVLRVESLAAPARVLRLERGHVVAELDPQPAGTTFSIATPEGMATAIGTAFSVEVPASGPSVLHVLHGVVRVKTAATDERLSAHRGAVFGGATRPLGESEEEADHTLLREGTTSAAKTPARLTLQSEPTGARVNLDGAFVGTTPLDTIVEPGSHVLSVEGEPKDAQLTLAEGEHLERVFRRPPSPPPPSPPSVTAPPLPAAAPPSPQAGPSEMLAAAQRAQAHGDTDAAARAYKRLLAAHGQSREADAAALSLGELELGSARYDEAIALFDRCIARRGPLLLEARFGKIRALRGKGRAAEERAAIADFVRDYPGSPQADALRSRGP